MGSSERAMAIVLWAIVCVAFVAGLCVGATVATVAIMSGL